VLERGSPRFALPSLLRKAVLRSSSYEGHAAAARQGRLAPPSSLEIREWKGGLGECLVVGDGGELVGYIGYGEEGVLKTAEVGT
jgi:hypothetical protein